MKRLALGFGILVVVVVLLGFWLRKPQRTEAGNRHAVKTSGNENQVEDNAATLDSTIDSEEAEAFSNESLDKLLNEDDFPVPKSHTDDMSIGDMIAEERTRKIIVRLHSESLEDSLEQLDYVDDYYYPGYYSQRFVPLPFERVQVILSNRRFIKLYEDLKDLDEQEQSKYLQEYLEKYLSQYGELLSGYKVENLPAGPRDYELLTRINEVEGRPATFHGTRHAIQSLMLLSGLLGNVRTIPVLKQILSSPLTGSEFDESEYERVVAGNLKGSPVAPLGIAAQAVFLMVHYGGEEESKAYGVDVDTIKGLIDDATVRSQRMPTYQSSVTQYDVRHRFGAPVDWSQGYFDFAFLLEEDRKILEEIRSTFVGEGH